MFKIWLAFWKSEPQYNYKRYAYRKKTCIGPFRKQLYDFILMVILTYELSTVIWIAHPLNRDQVRY